MIGTAKAVFTCGATVVRTLQNYAGTGKPKDVDHECENTVTVDLVNDGWYTMFNQPERWHVELGVFDPEKTLVRCPTHCRWIVEEIEVDFDGWGNKIANPRVTTQGHWEDDQ
jgi:hypothetical protein